jgi:hypothetical protein
MNAAERNAIGSPERFIIDAGTSPEPVRAYAPTAESAAAVVRGLRLAGYEPVTVRAWSEASEAYFTANF